MIFMYNLTHCHCIAYSVIALLAEVNTQFLHTRKLLQLHGAPFNSLVYRVTAAVNLLTFISCRFLLLVWIGYGIFFMTDRISLVYRTLTTISLFIMIAINTVLFWRLLSNDVLRPLRQRRSGSSGKHPHPPVTSNGHCHGDNQGVGVKGSVLRREGGDGVWNNGDGVLRNGDGPVKNGGNVVLRNGKGNGAVSNGDDRGEKNGFLRPLGGNGHIHDVHHEGGSSEAAVNNVNNCKIFNGLGKSKIV